MHQVGLMPGLGGGVFTLMFECTLEIWVGLENCPKRGHCFKNRAEALNVPGDTVGNTVYKLKEHWLDYLDVAQRGILSLF